MNDYKLVRGDAVRFLLGEEGEFKRPPGEGQFWWRNVLRNGVVGYHEAESEEITRLQSEVERLRGREADLEDECRNAQKYMVWLSGGKEVPTVKAWLLRKQAEAVEAEAREWNPDDQTYSGRKPHKEMIAYAQRLRQQADEAEGK